jgi:hypothetical protein
MHRAGFAALLVLALGGCAGVQVSRLSSNTFLIEAGSDATCGGAAAGQLASRAAAVETIRRGYQRFVIGGGSGEVGMGLGGQETSIRVVMLKPGDPGFEAATDARAFLGPNWAAIATSEIGFCP